MIVEEQYCEYCRGYHRAHSTEQRIHNKKLKERNEKRRKQGIIYIVLACIMFVAGAYLLMVL